MLVELRVANLGIVDDLTLLVGTGLTAITGETGAGKTLLVEAVELLLGARADASLVREGATEARVEGRFVDADGQERVLARVLPADGRARAYVDGRLATAAELAAVGATLVDLHGQNAHQSLLAPAVQRAALDRFAGAPAARRPRRPARGRAPTRAPRSLELDSLGGDARARARELDLLRFQIGEIEQAGLDDPGEDVALEAEEALLARRRRAPGRARRRRTTRSRTARYDAVGCGRERARRPEALRRPLEPAPVGARRARRPRERVAAGCGSASPTIPSGSRRCGSRRQLAARAAAQVRRHARRGARLRGRGPRPPRRARGLRGPRRPRSRRRDRRPRRRCRRERSGCRRPAAAAAGPLGTQVTGHLARPRDAGGPDRRAGRSRRRGRGRRRRRHVPALREPRRTRPAAGPGRIRRRAARGRCWRCGWCCRRRRRRSSSTRSTPASAARPGAAVGPPPRRAGAAPPGALRDPPGPGRGVRRRPGRGVEARGRRAARSRGADAGRRRRRASPSCRGCSPASASDHARRHAAELLESAQPRRQAHVPGPAGGGGHRREPLAPDLARDRRASRRSPARSRVDRRTKDLVKRLEPGEIAVIDHARPRPLAADGLVDAGVVAVVNADDSITRPLPERRPDPPRRRRASRLVDGRAASCSSDSTRATIVRVTDDGEVWRGDELARQGHRPRRRRGRGGDGPRPRPRSAASWSGSRTTRSSTSQREAQLMFEPLELPPLQHRASRAATRWWSSAATTTARTSGRCGPTSASTGRCSSASTAAPTRCSRSG